MTADAGNIIASSGRLPVAPGAQLQYPDDQKPVLQSKSLMILGREAYVQLYDTVTKDIKEIVQPAMGL